MKATISILLFLAFFQNDIEGQIGRLPLSPLQKIEQNIGITDITIVYSRPSMRGRDIFGGLVPYGELWRTGANRNTTIEFTEDVIINNKKVKNGKYAIFSIPNITEWEIILYNDTDNWDVPEEIDSSKIAATVNVKTNKIIEPAEVLSITIGDFTNYEFDLNIQWSNVSVSVPIKLTTKELMDEKINRILTGPSHNDYYAAAVYQMESGKEFEKGLEYINKAIEQKEDVSFWDLRVKAILLKDLGRYNESLEISKEGLIKAKEAKREYGINEFENLIKLLQNK